VPSKSGSSARLRSVKAVHCNFQLRTAETSRLFIAKRLSSVQRCSNPAGSVVYREARW